MRIGYLGIGAWGYCLAYLLASKGYNVVAWSVNDDVIRILKEKKKHPKLPFVTAPENLTFTTDLADVLYGKDLLVESITSAGIRQVFQQVKEIHVPDCPIVITSKGIEQNTGLLLSDVLIEVLGENIASK